MSVGYTLSDAEFALLAPHHRKVQVAIATLAAQRLGVPPDPSGIGKHQGGVRVNGREICIRRTGVVDDWASDTAPKSEERAVAAAILEVAALVRERGVEALATYDEDAVWFDPLRAMFDL